MPYQVIYDATGRILAAVPAEAPLDSLVLPPDQGSMFVPADLASDPLASLRIQAGELVPDPDWSPGLGGVRLTLSVQASALSPIDDVPELPADARSEATVTVRKRATHPDRPLTRARDNDLLTIRTTAGTLSTRQIPLVRGRAEFRLRSSQETVTAEVTVTAVDIPEPATVHIEFAPP